MLWPAPVFLRAGFGAGVGDLRDGAAAQDPKPNARLKCSACGSRKIAMRDPSCALAGFVAIRERWSLDCNR